MSVTHTHQRRPETAADRRVGAAARYRLDTGTMLPARSLAPLRSAAEPLLQLYFRTVWPFPQRQVISCCF